MQYRPVLYLDLDDTIISWDGGPHGAPGVHEFMVWAMDSFEVRWLTTWCPDGVMDEKLLCDLSRMVRIPVESLRSIRGFAWEADGSKLEGIAWLEHLVLGRPFIWLEDDYGFGQRERRFLRSHGLLASYRHCNVTEDSGSLNRVRRSLRSWVSLLREVAA